MRVLSSILIVSVLASPAFTLNVMHIGNSLTDHAYGMHNIAESKGHDVLMGRQMIPGAPLWWNWDNRTSGFWEPVWEDNGANLTNYSWDAIVLQAYRGEWTDDVPAAVNYINEVRKTNPSCKAYIYAHHHTETPGDFPATWAANQDLSFSRATFEKIAELVSAQVGTPVYIVPNGNVLYAVYQQIQLGNVPGVDNWLDLFPAADDIHLNNLGAYICACTHFATLYGQDPAGAPLSGLRNVDPAVPQAFAEFVWDIVWQTVTAYDKSGVSGSTGVSRRMEQMRVMAPATGSWHAYAVNGRQFSLPAGQHDAAVFRIVRHDEKASAGVFSVNGLLKGE